MRVWLASKSARRADMLAQIFPNLTCHGIESVDESSTSSVVSGQVLEICQIDFPVDQRVDNFQNSFSGGQLLRIGLARALYKKSEILFLDEPNSAIGAEQARAILLAIEDYYDGILVLTTHDKSIVGSFFNQKVFEYQSLYFSRSDQLLFLNVRIFGSK